MKLKGFIQSGIIFIGDPSYMAGDLSQPGSEDIVDPINPFKNWGVFTEGLKGEDVNMGFPGAIEDNSIGRGIVIQTGLLNGQYEIVKEYDSAGKLSQIVIKIRE